MIEKRIEIKQQRNSESYEVFYNGSSIGFIQTSRNRFHVENLYLQLQLISYDKELGKELFTLLQQEHNEPFQIMCDSTEKELIEFVEAAGFICKRKCYECEVAKEDLKAELQSEASMLLAKCPEKEYLEASKILYAQYIEKHAAVNPMTAAFEEFLEILPKEVYVELQEGKVINYAFIEENEIAYVGSINRNTYMNFIAKMVAMLFDEYETICFECDDTDWEAMRLKELFTIEDKESYNTYILERTEQ